MLVEMMKSKIHRIHVTEAQLDYIGSITLDGQLMDAANILDGERVYIVNVNNGERFDTYTIRGEDGSGVCCLNGPAARKVAVNDIIIVISYAAMEPEEAKRFKPTVLFPDTATNRLV
ncbi:MAG: aspartate 1-decarboxylase [Bacteroidetes bacterium]|nr:MAG: aspartate 1-decarboxylase [Bacteroidota bacterium]